MKKIIFAIAAVLLATTSFSYAQMFMRERPAESVSPDGPGSVQRSDGSVLKISDDGSIMVSADGNTPYVIVPGKKALEEKEGMTVERERFDWEDPTVIGINKEPYHATLDLPCSINDRSDVTVLDGIWKFHWSPDPQSRPQDNSNRSDVRWFRIGDGLRVSGATPFNFRAWPYAESELETKQHPHEVEMQDFLEVNIDSCSHGVGGNDAWGARTLPKYTIDGIQPQHFEITMEF